MAWILVLEFEPGDILHASYGNGNPRLSKICALLLWVVRYLMQYVIQVI